MHAGSPTLGLALAPFLPVLSAHSLPLPQVGVASLSPSYRAVGTELPGWCFRSAPVWGRAPCTPDPDLLDVGNQQALGLLVCLRCPSRGGKLLRICLWHRLRFWAGWPGAGLRGPGEQSKAFACLQGDASPGPGFLPPPASPPRGCPAAPAAGVGGPRATRFQRCTGVPGRVPRWQPDPLSKSHHPSPAAHSAPRPRGSGPLPPEPQRG